MDDVAMRALAAKCSQVVYHWAGPNGMSDEELRRRLSAVDALDAHERYRVFWFLAQSTFIATVGTGERWRFWARHFAPPGAYVAPVAGPRPRPTALDP